MIKVIQGDVTTLAVDAIVNAESRAGGEEAFISRGGAEKMDEMEVVFCCFSERDAVVYNSLV